MSPRAKKRWKIAIATFVVVVTAGVLLFPVGLRQVAGASAHEPEDYASRLSPATRALIDDRLRDLDGARLFDYHVHVAGVGADGSGCSVNPKMLSWAHPRHRLQFLAYIDAGRVHDMEHADREFVDRILSLARGSPKPGRYLLLAFDANHALDGSVFAEETEMHVPDSWPVRLSRAHPDVFVPAMSVHPYRADAVAALEEGHRAGARVVKWLPNAMGIDPADPRCDAFYMRMKELGVVLLTHGGEERAVDAEGAQELGNPLRLRRALDHGVRVIVAHCASDGHAIDLDDPARPEVEAFDLFLRLMDDPKYVGLVFGEISALTMYSRCGRPLETMLARTDLHARLVNGSDYPLPALNALFWTSRLAKLGYVTDDERRALNEIYDVNPLLFDLVTKRCLKHPTLGTQFPPSVFHELPESRGLGESR